MPWPPRADEVFKCLWHMFKECVQCDYIPVGITTSTKLPVGICESVEVPVGICESVCLKLDSRKEVHQLWSEPGISVSIGATIQSQSVELEDVNAIAFTVQRLAGHDGLSVYANLQTSPDDINWDTCNYAGFTNTWFCKDPGLAAQCTMPITPGPKYMRAEIENESFTDISIRAWLTLTKTC